MKWYEWVIGGTLSVLIVLIFLPLIIFIEWSDVMNIMRKKKQIIDDEQLKQRQEHIKSRYKEN